ncbi:hypothetical protein P7D22_13235 [Lichenihabitans sp. Uapishka_5]|uniref:hypothetical protein n=1 Tax=Lichenihabitans sp. Uapishka_5 TaxID=3037302 RepID=UPI0029E7E6AA|nr:hypothetical protein [Lichenihabitans sp. Uapishka_5]MDX7952138.1 hypothetical protein [Lichenihabitans sp. Uapishka_5]
MAPMNAKITSLPTRYEPLVGAFGDRAKATFISPDEDLAAMKRFIAAAQSSSQGKVLFLSASSGTGKSTFIHSLEVFLPDTISTVIRLPPPHELEVGQIPAFLASVARSKKFTVVNFDGREAPYFDEPEYQTFLGALNGILRSRSDLLVVWPVTDKSFSGKLIALLERVGGKSAFGPQAELSLAGIAPSRFRSVLEKILQVANWRLEDAAISETEIDVLTGSNERVGAFLDALQNLIAERFDIGDMGVSFPTLVVSISSGDPKIREIARSLRRADSYYIEASRLLMYTKKSNVAEWWSNRATDLKSALPHVIALFNAQLVTVSASAVVHSALQSADQTLNSLVNGVRADKGNATRVIKSCELFRFLMGEATDNREYGSNVSEKTFSSYDAIQAASETHHRSINKSLLDLSETAGAHIPGLVYENSLTPGLQTDAVFDQGIADKVALEFHHKASSESTQNKLAIYILEKLKEYSINFGLADR